MGDAKYFDGISELRIDYGPGYRLYCVRRGTTFILLLCGGDKPHRIATSPARGHWPGSRDMVAELKVFDPAEYLTDPEVQEELLAEAFATGHPGFIANVLGTVARARGMTATAKKAGVTREALHKALSPNGNPTLTTLLGVTKALGFQLKLVPLATDAHTKAAE